MAPLLIAQIAAAVVSAIGKAGASTANNKMQRTNKERIREIDRLQASGDIGLNGIQKQQMQRDLYNPVQRAAAEGRLQAEKQMAAIGSTSSAGTLADLRREQVRTNAAGARDASMAVRNADFQLREQRKAALQAEEDARLLAQGQMRADDWALFNNATSSAGKSAGQIAGAPPGTYQQSGLAGAAPPALKTGLAPAPAAAPTSLVQGTPAPAFTAADLAAMKAAGVTPELLAKAQAFQAAGGTP